MIEINTFTWIAIFSIVSAVILPEARNHEKKHSILAFLAGVALAIIIILTKLIN